MDPNKILDDALKIANDVMFHPACSSREDAQDAIDLAARLLDLDDWIRAGGPLPVRWVVTK